MYTRRGSPRGRKACFDPNSTSTSTFVITDDIFPVKHLKSQSITKLDILVLPIFR